MWIPLKKIVPQAAKRLRLKEGLKESSVFSDWDKHLTEQFGSVFFGKSKPVALKNKTLVIDCLNSSWAAELNLRQEKIFHWIRKKLGRDKLKKIRFIS